MIELIVGGARSGKSSHALRVAESLPGNRHFIATAEARDGEMADRIARHQKERSASWQLTEETCCLSGQTPRFAEPDVVLVDCLTLWVANWLGSGNADGWPEEKRRFLDGLAASRAHWLLVSNETGMGVVPADRLSRQFVDESGRLHQELSAIAHRVTLVTMGIPRVLKRREDE
ncbi:MAG: bifunctional adenosylcobinamide kinase/adenosylcobinamide-phosphate guanylyltransferase [Gammaproteobacteria bacterium]|nr:bifunctional adenosylcobinamide kinase/adenosylcobinamide-phosphate guanylyltransferase [Gammaproteobacteria bacterium]